jgi:O-antigen/teichoic acid export membrane protein
MATLPEVAPAHAEGVRLPSLRWSFGWSLLGNGAYSFCQWAALAIIAKLGSADMVGQYALALAIAAPVFMFTNLQLRAVQVTDARGENAFADYAALRVVGSVAALLAVTGFAFTVITDRSTRLLLVFVALWKLLESFSDIFAGEMQKHERLDCASVSLLWRGGLSLLVFWAIFVRSHSLSIAYGATLAVALAVLCAYDVPVARRFLRPGSLVVGGRQALWRLFRLSLPLGCSMALISLNINIPRYVLERYAGRAELGIFASLGYVVLAINLLVSALGQSVSVRLSSFHADNEIHDFKRLLTKLCVLGASVGVLGMPLAALVGKPLLTLMYRPEYAEHLPVFLVLVLSAGFTAVGSFLGYGITAARIFRPQLVLMTITVGATLVASMVFIPRLQMMGAALALLLSSVVFVFTAGWILWCDLRRERAA